MRIYPIDEARRTILKRTAIHRMEYSPLTLQRTEEFFGRRITPPQAVEMILRSVEENGDKAIRAWSEKLDGFSGEEISVRQTRMKAAWNELPPPPEGCHDKS